LSVGRETSSLSKGLSKRVIAKLSILLVQSKDCLHHSYGQTPVNVLSMECLPDSCKMILDHSEITWDATLCLLYVAS
jgi:hypothetical protein